MPKQFTFTVREVTERTAIVTAGSLTQARGMLKEWAQQSAEGCVLADEVGGPIVLGDLETIRITSEHQPAR